MRSGVERSGALCFRSSIPTHPLRSAVRVRASILIVVRLYRGLSIGDCVCMYMGTTY